MRRQREWATRRQHGVSITGRHSHVPTSEVEFSKWAGRGGATRCWSTRGVTKLEMELFSGCPSTLPTVKWKWLRVWQAHAYLT